MKECTWNKEMLYLIHLEPEIWGDKNCFENRNESQKKNPFLVNNQPFISICFYNAVSYNGNENLKKDSIAS